MADRRMFSKKIIDSDAFLELPLSTQCLYFHLAMRADDDGFLNNAKKIMKIIGAVQEDYEQLVQGRFIIQFDDGICVIKHWRIHNYLRSDRYKGTQYTEEKSRLYLKENGAYTLNKEKSVTSLSTIGIPDDNQMDTAGIPLVAKRLTQDRIGKSSVVKNSLVDIKKYICSEPGDPAPNCSDIFLPLVDGTFYNVPNNRIENWARAFPIVDVHYELLKMLTWLESNPKKRKTSGGINRFINNWLSRRQDNGGSKQEINQPDLQTTKDGRVLE